MYFNTYKHYQTYNLPSRLIDKLNYKNKYELPKLKNILCYIDIQNKKPDYIISILTLLQLILNQHITFYYKKIKKKRQIIYLSILLKKKAINHFLNNFFFLQSKFLYKKELKKIIKIELKKSYLIFSLQNLSLFFLEGRLQISKFNVLKNSKMLLNLSYTTNNSYSNFLISKLSNFLF